ncbi:MAG: hypothetical protein Q8R07_00335 [Candidatus Uhrbacteria bacterium]|nr:hypothetical protein [Candidatus Uhrbacteria bacterium]
MLAIALCDNEDDLTRAEKAFPECFLPEPAQHPGPFPLSLIRQLCDEHCLQDDHALSDFSLNDGVRLLGLPHVLCAHPDSKHFERTGAIAMPQTINEMYAELVERTGPRNDYCFPRALHEVVIDATRYYMGWIYPDDTGDPDNRDMILWPAACIDVNA